MPTRKNNKFSFYTKFIPNDFVYSMSREVTVDDVRSFTMEQFERIKKTNDMKKLVHFHTINKYLLMAHGQQELRILGNLVANREKTPMESILKKYEDHLKLALKGELTIPSTVNALNKIYSHFKKKFTSEEKKLFLRTIEDYRNEKISLGEILNHVEGYIHKYENGYLQRQTFYLLYSDVEKDSLSLN